MYEKEIIPNCIAIGISYKEFWHMNPKIIECYIAGHTLKKKEQDIMNWYLGQYVLSAVATALDNGFNGKKAKSEYIKEPIMSSKYFGLSQDEIDKIKLQEMIDFEMGIIDRQKQKGSHT